jgi:hypothetical protein
MTNIDINEIISKSEAPPIFAEEAGVLVRLKASQDEKKNVRKEGLVSIIFIDTVRQKVLGEFVINQITAAALQHILGDTLKKLEEELRSSKLPVGPEPPKTSNMSYR